MKTENYKPFLEWVSSNTDLSYTEDSFIKNYVLFHSNLDTACIGIWGYLLSYFDSIDNVLVEVYSVPNEGWVYNIESVDDQVFMRSGFKSREAAQLEAVEITLNSLKK